MPLIDLDHQVQAPSSRAPRWRPRMAIPLTAGLLFVSLVGDPSDSLSPHEEATLCPTAVLAVRAADAKPLKDHRLKVVLLDAETGEATRVIHCPVR